MSQVQYCQIVSYSSSLVRIPKFLLYFSFWFLVVSFLFAPDYMIINFLLLSGRIIKKLGIVNCITFVLVLQAIRFSIATTISGSIPIIVVFVVWLDGILYGTAYAIITSYANRVAFPGTETTVQAMFNCIYDGIGTRVLCILSILGTIPWLI